MDKMTTKRAIEILDPDTEPVWRAAADTDLETVKEACRVAVKALRKRCKF